MGWFPLDAAGWVDLTAHRSLSPTGTVERTGVPDLGQALSLTGSGYVSGATTIPTLSVPYSVMAWFRPNFSDTTSNRHMLVCRGTSGASTRFGNNIQYLGDINQWRCDSTPGGGLGGGDCHFSDSLTPFSAGEVHHVGFSIDATGAGQGYWDGLPKTTTNGMLSFAPDPAYGDPFFVGTINAISGDERYFNGAVWDVRVYNRALTDVEWLAVFNQATRWDLYWVPGRRVFFDIGAGSAFQAAWARGANVILQPGIR